MSILTYKPFSEMIDKYNRPVADMLELLDSFSEDHLATAHLLLSFLVQVQMVGSESKWSYSFYTEYLRKASSFIKNLRSQFFPELLSHQATMATEALACFMKDTLDVYTKERAPYNRVLLFQIIKHILLNYHQHFGDKTFKETFDDISFRDHGIFSKKASQMVLRRLYEIETEGTEDADFECIKKAEEVLDLSGDHWHSVNTLLTGMAPEIAMVYHGISLLLCRRYLEPDLYATYRKKVIQAIYDYHERNRMLKPKVMKKVRRMFIDFKDGLIEQLMQKYDSCREDPTNKVIFTLASDLCLQSICTIQVEQAQKILLDLYPDWDYVYTSGTFQEYAILCSNEALEKLNRIYREQTHNLDNETEIQFGPNDGQSVSLSNFSSNKEEENTRNQKKNYQITTLSSKEYGFGTGRLETSEDKKTKDGKTAIDSKAEEAISNLKDFLLKYPLGEMHHLLSKFDLEHDIFFHAVTITILSEGSFRKDLFKDYEEEVLKMITTYNRTGGNRMKAARKRADKVFEKTFNGLFSGLDSGELKEKHQKVMNYITRLNAIAQCLKDTQNINAEIVEGILICPELDLDPWFYTKEITIAYELKYLVRSSKEIKRLLGSIATFNASTSED